MKTSATSIPSRLEPSARAVQSPFIHLKTVAACITTCLVMGAATGAPFEPTEPSSDGGQKEEKGVLNEFSGGYSGQSILSGTGVTAAGTADGFIRGGKVGGGMTLRTTVAASGQTIKFKRTLKFKRRSFNSKTLLIGNGLVQSGVGKGRYTAKQNFLRYTDNSVIQTFGITQPVTITGNVKFFKRSIRVNEIWIVSGQTLTFGYNLRSR